MFRQCYSNIKNNHIFHQSLINNIKFMSTKKFMSTTKTNKLPPRGNIIHYFPLITITTFARLSFKSQKTEHKLFKIEQTIKDKYNVTSPEFQEYILLKELFHSTNKEIQKKLLRPTDYIHLIVGAFPKSMMWIYLCKRIIAISLLLLSDVHTYFDQLHPLIRTPIVTLMVASVGILWMGTGVMLSCDLLGGKLVVCQKNVYDRIDKLYLDVVEKV